MSMKSICAIAAALVVMILSGGAASAASVAFSADSFAITGCSQNQAIGGGVVILSCAGNIHGSVSFPSSGDGTYQIGIAARSNLNWGFAAPSVQVSIDGAAVGSVSVSSASFTTYTLSKVVAKPGSHTLTIAYNPIFQGLDLYIKSVTITPNGSAAAPPPAMSGSPDAYQQQLLNLINASRASGGLPPYTFSAVQSAGTASCVGSYGHSVHMAQQGQISHDQFPQDICIAWTAAGENVGEASGNETEAIQLLHQDMMNEGPSGGHYQNIMSRTFTTVGIGLYYSNGTLWLTEDFVR
jgi:uncharacterized protein YkwD